MLGHAQGISSDLPPLPPIKDRDRVPAQDTGDWGEDGRVGAESSSLWSESLQRSSLFPALVEYNPDKHIAEMFASRSHFRLQVAKTDFAPIYRYCIWLCAGRLLLLHSLASSQMSFSLKGSDFWN